MNETEIINKTSDVLKKVFSRVALHEPYYTLLRELQRDIHLWETRKERAAELKSKGKTIREIAKEMGYKHPGSISHLLSQSKPTHQ